MEIVSQMTSALWEVWKEMFELIMEILPKAFNFLIWILCGILILPCVYIANNYFSKWADWGEETF